MSDLTILQIVCTLAGITPEELADVNAKLRGLPEPFGHAMLELRLHESVDTAGWVTSGEALQPLPHPVVGRIAVRSPDTNPFWGHNPFSALRRARAHLPITGPASLPALLGGFALTLEHRALEYEISTGPDGKDKAQLIEAARNSVSEILRWPGVLEYVNGTPGVREGVSP